MNLQMRINLATQLGKYILSDDPSWQEAKERAERVNPWFIQEFIKLASENIAHYFLEKDLLEKWASGYNCQQVSPKKVGIVMAGNIPLVGFHDLLCVFISGHSAIIKPSSKDEVQIKHLVNKLYEWDETVQSLISFEEMLKGCDAYIATGSNNSARYFEYYFSKYPHIIRKNRTSVAILDGNESDEDLENLADDVHQYFGMGCRNVTKIYVPEEYDFVPLLKAFRKYNHFKDHHKFKNNYDYHLAIHILNNKFYMTNESIILLENESLFSPISQLNYEFYNDKNEIINKLKLSNELQCLTGKGFMPSGQAQKPSLSDYADGVDTMDFLTSL